MTILPRDGLTLSIHIKIVRSVAGDVKALTSLFINSTLSIWSIELINPVMTS